MWTPILRANAPDAQVSTETVNSNCGRERCAEAVNPDSTAIEV